MFDLEFENGDWIHATWFVVVMVVLFGLLELRRRSRANLWVDPRMKSRLARTIPTGSRIMSLVLWAGGMMFFVVALMRPQYGFMEKSVPHVGAQIMVCLDVSKSMLAEDASPNRLERAKSELEVLLNYLKDDQTGLIAFAGKANVLCPMTTDLGYLKMVLRETTPTSVGQGGTQLESPIRRAMAGFAENEEMSKLIILITDGEDNGSKPLDAAKEAAERGIRIITIGFGHERGSKIEITDPRTGLTNYVKDPQGQVVISKLDLETLKEIAALTRGACVPARTGALDVETIYDDHIRPLMRSTAETRMVVKNEAFQWPLVIGIVLIFLSIMVQSPLAFSPIKFNDWLMARSTSRLGVIVFCVTLSFLNGRDHLSYAQDVPTTTPPIVANRQTVQDSATQTTPGDEKSKGLGSEFSSKAVEESIPDDPMECYNQSVELLRSNPEYAERLLEAARRDAGDDARLRFRSAYNLGWAKVFQANQLLESQPEEALSLLNASADWFGESVRLRPKNEQARQNLEIVLKRITELRDSINRQDPAKFEQKLEELIQRQAGMLNRSRQLLRYSQQESSIQDSDELNKEFRSASVDQRLLNSDLLEAARQATELVEDFEKRKSNSGGPPVANNQQQDEQLKMLQMARSLDYVERAAQRLGQTRTQLRLRNASRASLRSAIGLDELKRARDQLRDPADTLRQLISDSRLLQRQTESFVAGSSKLGAFLGTQSKIPQWLSAEYLAQFQTTQTERTAELAELLRSVSASNQGDGSPGGSAQQSETAPEKKSDMQKKYLAAAARLVGDAADLFVEAQTMIEGTPAKAAKKQSDAILRLRDAYELFADLKGLLEITYASHVELNQKLTQAEKLKGDVLRQVAESFKKQAEKDAERLNRMVDLIDEKLTSEKTGTGEIKQGDPKQNDSGSDQNSSQPAELKKLELAKSIAERLQVDHQTLREEFNKYATGSDEGMEWAEVMELSSGIESGLLDLRRLFFSIVEHLKETLTRQQRLAGDTDLELARIEQSQKTTAKPSADRKQEPTEPETGFPSAESLAELLPLKSRQLELASLSEQIGQTLKEMSENTNQQLPPGNEAATGGQEMMQKYAEASQLVLEGKSQMEVAASELEPADPAGGDDDQSNPQTVPGKDGIESDKIRTAQSSATEELAKALRLLEPPKGNDQQKSPQNKSQPQEQKDNSNQALLQRIRDQEAQRRKSKRQERFPERAVKDW